MVEEVLSERITGRSDECLCASVDDAVSAGVDAAASAVVVAGIVEVSEVGINVGAGAGAIDTGVGDIIGGGALGAITIVFCVTGIVIVISDSETAVIALINEGSSAISVRDILVAIVYAFDIAGDGVVVISVPFSDVAISTIFLLH